METHYSQHVLLFQISSLKVNRLGVSRVPKFGGSWARPLGWVRGWLVRNTLLCPGVCYRAKFDHSRSNHTTAINGVPPETWPIVSRLSTSLKVIGAYMDRSSTQDFLPATSY